MKILNIFLGCLFVVAAALQYNDPDPYIWMSVYLYGALVCFLAAWDRYYKWAIIAGMVVYFIYMLTFVPGVESWWVEHERENIAQTMKVEKPWIEETREFFGLLILLLVFAWHYFRMRKLSARAGARP